MLQIGAASLLQINASVATNWSRYYKLGQLLQIGAYHPLLCGYRKWFSTQYALLPLTERWRLCLDKQGFAGALLMDLSKAFDTINHELVKAKLPAYGFFIEALEVLEDIYNKGGKESRSLELLVHGLSYFKEFHKDRFLAPCCLIFTSMICFLRWTKLVFVTLQMTQLYAFVTQTWNQY